MLLPVTNPLSRIPNPGAKAPPRSATIRLPCRIHARDGPEKMSSPVKPLATRERLSEVRYEIRGELARRARELEAQGRKLIKLNIGNPGAFGFRAPAHLQHAIADDMGRTDPYTHQQGLPVAREAIAAAYARRGAPDAVATLSQIAPASKAAVINQTKRSVSAIAAGSMIPF